MKHIIGFFLQIVFLLSSVGYSSELNQVPLTNTPLASPQTFSHWDIDIYGEAYKSITQQIPIYFSRWMINRKQTFSNNGTFKVGFENFTADHTSTTPYQTQWIFSLGYYYTFNQYFTFMTSFRAENINLKTSQQQFPLRTGFLGGTFNFHNASQTVFTESYYEGYLQTIREAQINVMSMGNAFLKLGYRWSQSKAPFFIDPLILEVRGYSTNRPILAGDSYSLLNIGSRFIFYHESPLLYSSLFITKPWRLDKPQSNSLSPWVLFTFGGTF